MIDYNISNKYCYFDMPYNFGIQHLKLAFKPPLDAAKKSTINLKNRVAHVFIGIAELIIPVIGHIIAIAEKCFSNRASSSKRSSPIKATVLTKSPDIPNIKFSSHPSKIHEPSTAITPKLATDKIHAASSPIAVVTSPPTINKTINPSKISKPIVDSAPVSSHPTVLTNKSARMQNDEFIKAVEERNHKKVGEFLNAGYLVRDKGFYISERFGDTNLHHSVSPLYVAMKNNDYEMFDLLLKSQTIDLYFTKHFPIHPDPSDYQKKFLGTALHFACSLGPKGDEFIKRLIEKRCDPFLKCDEKTAYDLAKENQVSQGVLFKLQIYMIKQRVDQEGLSNLHRYIMSKDLEGVKKALESGASLDFGLYSTWGTPLSYAVFKFMKTGDPVYEQMITLLLENGAHPDYGTEDLRPLTLLLVNQFEGWENIAKLLLDKGADPIFYLDLAKGLNNNHPIRKRIMQDPQVIETLLLKNISTVWGLKTNYYREREGTKFVEGGNHSAYIYDLVNNITQKLIKDNIVKDLLDTSILEALPKICQFSNEMLLTKNSDADYAALLEKIKSSELPVVIPSGWFGHANSIVIWKNVMIKCNLNVKDKSGFHVSYFDQSKFDTNCLTRILDTYFNARDPKKADDDFNFFDKEINAYLDSKEEKLIPLEMQKFGNCTWASSAFLGLMAAVNLLKTINKPEEADLIKHSPQQAARVFGMDSKTMEFSDNFEHFSKHFVMKQYLNALREHNLEGNHIISRAAEACKIELETLGAKIAETNGKRKKARLQEAHKLYSELLNEFSLIKS